MQRHRSASSKSLTSSSLPSSAAPPSAGPAQELEVVTRVFDGHDAVELAPQKQERYLDPRQGVHGVDLGRGRQIR